MSVHLSDAKKDYLEELCPDCKSMVSKCETCNDTGWVKIKDKPRIPVQIMRSVPCQIVKF